MSQSEYNKSKPQTQLRRRTTCRIMQQLQEVAKVTEQSCSAVHSYQVDGGRTVQAACEGTITCTAHMLLSCIKIQCGSGILDIPVIYII